MADDACTRKIKRQYKVWPSARASQAVAKCRKSKGNVRKGKAGKSLRRWAKEKWVEGRLEEKDPVDPAFEATSTRRTLREARRQAREIHQNTQEVTMTREQRRERMRRLGRSIVVGNRHDYRSTRRRHRTPQSHLGTDFRHRYRVRRRRALDRPRRPGRRRPGSARPVGGMTCR